jgi:hypothetical protein
LADTELNNSSFRRRLVAFDHHQNPWGLFGAERFRVLALAAFRNRRVKVDCIKVNDWLGCRP